MDCNLNIRFAFTGAPGAGKTSAAETIKEMTDVMLINEAATRLLLKYENDPLAITKMIAEVKDLQVEDMSHLHKKPIEIFDRTLLDSLIFDEHNSISNSQDYISIKNQMKTNYLFSCHAFLFALPPESEYKQTNSRGEKIRMENYKTSLILQEKFIKGYESSGFTVHIIPWMELNKRANMVFNRMQEIVAANSRPHSYPNFELHRFAVAMNDEGGRLTFCIDKTKQIFTNLSVVLDRPYIDGTNFNELQKIRTEKQYKTKEEALDHFNDKQTNFSYCMIMNYYIKNACRIIGKDDATLIFHTFRGGDGPNHLENLKETLDIGSPELKGKRLSSEGTDLAGEVFRYEFPDYHSTVLFSFGKADLNPEKTVYTQFKNSTLFKNADIIVSFSVHFGLHPDWEAGTLIIPNKWTPIDLNEMKIQTLQSYEGKNHLLESIDQILNDSDQTSMLQNINQGSKSKNVNKKGMYAAPLARKDFKTGHFIELGGYIFTPENAPKKAFILDVDSTSGL